MYTQVKELSAMHRASLTSDLYKVGLGRRRQGHHNNLDGLPAEKATHKYTTPNPTCAPPTRVVTQGVASFFTGALGQSRCLAFQRFAVHVFDARNTSDSVLTETTEQITVGPCAADFPRARVVGWIL